MLLQLLALAGVGSATVVDRREGLWRRMVDDLRRARHPRPDRTRQLITEAENTCHELTELTSRLNAHVAALRDYARAYARQHEGSP